MKEVKEQLNKSEQEILSLINTMNVKDESTKKQLHVLLDLSYAIELCKFKLSKER